ncbi:MAG: choice-of-anchor X domain-containing protein [Planctomycetota bacterium]|jgi:hypothetical protein
MKKTGLILLVLSLSAGCTQQLAMTDARSEPAELSPGDEAIVSVKVIDAPGVVAAVTATVRQERSVVLDLNDNGDEGDKAAGDGVWSSVFTVPGSAGAGDYNWDFEAFDENNDPVEVVTSAGASPLTAEASVIVAY